MAAVVLVAGAACARLDLRGAASPATESTSTPELSTIAGQWRGTVADSQLAEPDGMKTARVDLVIAPDGTWTGVEKYKNSVRRSAGTVRIERDHVVLDGKIVDGDSALIGKPIGYDLKRYRERDAYGFANSYFVGSRWPVPIALRKIS
jgi:hypothetical protein